ncbi:MAG TPA: PhzF family phenazine biosynthesis protein [Thermoanaerobaculia bacterium]|jgi:PhzF family phenazine biosynthesis protein|nr:PhzF family phenazine biosynthesis protein [Thermoanaerobaculia bacterium]
MPGPIGFHHVDVFTSRPYSGNSLAVFPDAAGLTGIQMERITKELRHFESIFLERDGGERACRAPGFRPERGARFRGPPGDRRGVGASCAARF